MRTCPARVQRVSRRYVHYECVSVATQWYFFNFFIDHNFIFFLSIKSWGTSLFLFVSLSGFACNRLSCPALPHPLPTYFPRTSHLGLHFFWLTLSVHAQEGYSSSPVCVSICTSVTLWFWRLLTINHWFRDQFTQNKDLEPFIVLLFLISG